MSVRCVESRRIGSPAPVLRLVHPARTPTRLQASSEVLSVGSRPARRRPSCPALRSRLSTLLWGSHGEVSARFKVSLPAHRITEDRSFHRVSGTDEFRCAGLSGRKTAAIQLETQVFETGTSRPKTCGFVGGSGVTVRCGEELGEEIELLCTHSWRTMCRRCPRRRPSAFISGSPPATMSSSGPQPQPRTSRCRSSWWKAGASVPSGCWRIGRGSCCPRPNCCSPGETRKRPEPTIAHRRPLLLVRRDNARTDELRARSA